MNWDRIAGQWMESRGKVRARWGMLTDDDLDIIAGLRDELVGLLQKRYGIAKDAVEHKVKEFESEWNAV